MSDFKYFLIMVPTPIVLAFFWPEIFFLSALVGSALFWVIHFHYASKHKAILKSVTVMRNAHKGL